MDTSAYSYLYGPVPSRRLGRSLGIDLVPYKVCNYDCIYCQLGSIGGTSMVRREYVPVNGLLAELKRKLAGHNLPDYICLAGSGEPTLHSGIGEVIRGIKKMTTVPVAVLTNGSLFWMPEVREALLGADVVMPSLDAGDKATFQAINRPDADIDFDRMVEGLLAFSSDFQGLIWLEIMLLADINDSEKSLHAIAEQVKRIKPARVQLNTVRRPPAEQQATAVPYERLQRFEQFFPNAVEIISDVRSLPITPSTSL